MIPSKDARTVDRVRTLSKIKSDEIVILVRPSVSGDVNKSKLY